MRMPGFGIRVKFHVRIRGSFNLHCEAAEMPEGDGETTVRIANGAIPFHSLQAYNL